MIRYHNPKQRTITAFDWPFQTVLDEHNRWVTLSRCIPWEALAAGYNQQFSRRQGRPAKEARLVIGAVIIKHKLNLSDRETVAQIQDDSMDGGGRAPSGTSAENPYLQYFVGLSGYQAKAIVKQRRPGRKALRRGIKQQLPVLRRNLGHIEGLLE